MISAVVVLYNPDKNVLQNIYSYIDVIDILYAVDNSDQKNSDLIASLLKHPKIHYIDNDGNRGIAQALNTGAIKAIEQGYAWLLTMDQDSRAHPAMLEHMIQYIHNNQVDEISIVAPFHANIYHSNFPSKEAYTPVLTTMTSGNLLNLNVYNKIGGFLEELFIDYVDNEYCLRSHLHNYKIIQINQAILHHNLGDLKKHRLLWKDVYSTNHSPLRRYYIFRNRCKIISLYGTYFSKYNKYEISRFFVDIIIVLLYEQHKQAKLKMMLRGYMDCKRGIVGKYQ